MIITSIDKTKELLVDILNSKKKLALFLGAGASKCQGFPLIKELTQIALEQLTPSSREVLNYIKRNTPILLFCNVEHMLGILLSFEKIGSFSEDQLNRTVIELKKHIFDNCKKIPQEDYHYRFFTEIAAHRSCGGPIDVFTTNYDISIEFALDHMGALYTTGVTGVFNRHWFGSALLSSTLLSNKRDSEGRLSQIPFIYFRVIKLHGSVSWYYDHNMVIHEMIDLNNLEFDIRRIPIIYPSIEKGGKFRFQKPYWDLSLYFNSTLETSPMNLLFIGYSFGDEHLNRTIFKAMEKNQELSILIFCNRLFPNLEIPELNVQDGIRKKIEESQNQFIICDGVSWQFEKLSEIIETLPLPKRTSSRVDSYSDPYVVARIVPNEINWPENYGLRDKDYVRKGAII